MFSKAQPGGKDVSIGSQIAKRRKELGMTQESLAFSLGVSFQAVSAWEREIYLPETDKLKHEAGTGAGASCIASLSGHAQAAGTCGNAENGIY